MPIKHAFVSGIADGADATVVRPSDWNAEHDVSEGPWWTAWNAPASPDAANKEFQGSDLTGLTRVYNSGTPKGSWTEKYGGAIFGLTATGGNPELDVFALSRSMSIGDYVEIAGAYQCNPNYLGLFVGFADGTTFNNSGSHVVGAFIHVDTGAVNTRALLNIWDGYNTRTSDGTIYDTSVPKGVIQAWRVKYEAANTFGLYYSLDGVNWHTVQSNYAKTMTPSYVLFGVSMLSAPASGQGARLEYFRVNA